MKIQKIIAVLTICFSLNSLHADVFTEALHEKYFKNNFKNISDTLAKQAPVLQQFVIAQQKKNLNQINKLKPQVQKIKTALSKINVNIKNSQGQTPLMLNPKIAPIIYALDKNKAKNTVNAKDKKGKTVLQYLITSPYANNLNLYKALISAGVKATPSDIKAAKNKLKGKPALKSILALLQKSKKSYQVNY